MPAVNPQTLQWRKGHARDEVSASKCIHLSIEPHMTIGLRQVKAQVALAGQEQAGKLLRVITGIPELNWICRSPEMAGYHRQFLADDLKPQLDKFVVGQEICRYCQLWRAAQ